MQLLAVLGLLLVFSVGFLGYACIAAAARSDEQAERMFEERQRQQQNEAANEPQQTVPGRQDDTNGKQPKKRAVVGQNEIEGPGQVALAFCF